MSKQSGCGIHLDRADAGARSLPCQINRMPQPLPEFFQEEQGRVGGTGDAIRSNVQRSLPKVGLDEAIRGPAEHVVRASRQRPPGRVIE